jgi:hypothetical protein
VLSCIFSQKIFLNASGIPLGIFPLVFPLQLNRGLDARAFCKVFIVKTLALSDQNSRLI